MNMPVNRKLSRLRQAGLLLAVIAAVGAGFGTGMSPVWAADNNSFPEVQSAPDADGDRFAGPAWRLSQESPSSALTQQYTTNRNVNDTENGRFFHVLKNEASSQVRAIRIRAYFPTNPGNVTVNITQQDGACNFTSPDTNQRIRMYIGGTPAYDGAAHNRAIERIDEERHFFKFDGDTGIRVERGFMMQQDKSIRNITEACEGMSAKNYNILQYDERCGDRNPKPNDTCKGADVNNSGGDDLTEYRDPIPYNPSTGTNPGLTNKFEGDFTRPAAVQQVGSNLFAVDIDVELSGAQWNDVQNQVRFKIRVDGAQFLGFRDLSTEPKVVREQSFGISNRGGFDDTEWGIRAYMPFGMSCRDNQNEKQGIVSIYDVDIHEFGYSYMSVFERDPENNTVKRVELTPTENANWQDTANRIQATGREGESSSAAFTMRKGFQYMLVVVNPNQRPIVPSIGPGPIRSPLNNLLSLGLPGESLYGIYNCNYTLTPSVDAITPNFSYDASFSVTGRIDVAGDDFETHNWQLTRIIYPSGAPVTAATINGQPPCAFRAGDCQVIDSGAVATGFGTTDFATSPYAFSQSNVPLGSRICFMMSVTKPTLRNHLASDWSHSELQCSQSVATPKVQIHGEDLKATGQVSTSVGRVGAQMYGSWGEYAVLSNGANIGMGSGNGLNGGIPAATGQESWKPLTFASGASQFGGIYGNFGGVTVPAPLVNRDGEVTGPPSIGSLAGLERKKIYRIPGTLRITGNLDYGVFGPFNDIADIPRIVLVADDIIIDPGVTNIDPWLVAIGAGGQPGKISTCSTVTGWSMSGAALYGAQSGAGGICTQQLRFNGPVLANKVYLYRTFDNRNGDPAEIFNLRADAYLSALSGGGTTKPVATTDFTTELPPRF